MATVSVSVVIDKRELERLIRKSPEAARAIVSERAQLLRADVQRRMPKQTGATARNTREVRRGEYEWAIEMPDVPARFLIEGTKPHIIRPRRPGGVLRFGVGGSIVYAKVVHHPGTKPYSFAADAARAALTPFQRAAAALWKVR